jgi:hypothetical protein
MTVASLKSFSKSSGLDANKEKGSFSGKLLGKAANGMEALAAIKVLAQGHANRFMELAIQAAKIAKQTLSAAKTIPFASQDIDFNAAINPVAAAAAPKGLSLGASSSKKKKKRSEGESKT